MSEPVVAPEEPVVTPLVPVPTAPVIPAQDLTDWKAESRKWEDRAKENKTAADELAAIKDSQLTEAQRQSDALAAAQKLASDSSADALRARVALEKGLTAAQEKRLIGSTKEELLADADELLADLGSQKPAVPSSSAIARANTTQLAGDIDAAITAAVTARNFPLVASLRSQKATELAKKG